MQDSLPTARLDLGGGDFLTADKRGYIYGRDNVYLQDLFDRALDPYAEVDLDGCFTASNAFYWPFSGGGSVAAYFSRGVRGRTVRGGTFLSIRLGRDDMIAVERLFLNGKQVTLKQALDEQEQALERSLK